MALTKSYLSGKNYTVIDLIQAMNIYRHNTILASNMVRKSNRGSKYICLKEQYKKDVTYSPDRKDFS